MRAGEKTKSREDSRGALIPPRNLIGATPSMGLRLFAHSLWTRPFGVRHTVIRHLAGVSVPFSVLRSGVWNTTWVLGAFCIKRALSTYI